MSEPCGRLGEECMRPTLTELTLSATYFATHFHIRRLVDSLELYEVNNSTQITDEATGTQRQSRKQDLFFMGLWFVQGS